MLEQFLEDRNQVSKTISEAINELRSEEPHEFGELRFSVELNKDVNFLSLVAHASDRLMAARLSFHLGYYVAKMILEKEK